MQDYFASFALFGVGVKQCRWLKQIGGREAVCVM